MAANRGIWAGLHPTRHGEQKAGIAERRGRVGEQTANVAGRRDKTGERTVRVAGPRGGVGGRRAKVAEGICNVRGRNGFALERWRKAGRLTAMGAGRAWSARG